MTAQSHRDGCQLTVPLTRPRTTADADHGDPHAAPTESGTTWLQRRIVPLKGYDAGRNRWTNINASGTVTCIGLTVATFNIWFNRLYARQRYNAIAALLSTDPPDVMMFQEVTPAAMRLFLTQPWVRKHYLCAEVTGGDLGDCGMLMLSRLPINGVTYIGLPTRLARGILVTELTINRRRTSICSVHLESGLSSGDLRRRQLRCVFDALKSVDTAIVVGDFNFAEGEDVWLAPDYHDLWSALRPGDSGFTGDTSINLMRFDSKGMHNQVRPDRIFLKGFDWTGDTIDLLGVGPISSALPRIFPSDHFGLQARLTHACASTTAADRNTGAPKPKEHR